jgi:hypothetical protein
MWKRHIYKVGSHKKEFDEIPEEEDFREKCRKHIEPWLSAVFQSEHLSLLLGSGFTMGIASVAGGRAAAMATPEFNGHFADEINAAAKASAKKSARGEPNFEDYIRVANELLRGCEILGHDKTDDLRRQINEKLSGFLKSILVSEQSILQVFDRNEGDSWRARNLLVSFLLSFASRAASRERLNLFTTNYDRLIEYGCDLTGLRVVDRFVGVLTPVFRASRLNIDLHYNPPGIRGEPRYLEGVIRLFKLHGSLDWRLEGKNIRRYGVPLGASSDHPDIPKEPLDSVMVYPNAAKDVETSEFPYAELFRDFAAATCRPNSVLVTYGYGFGDDHINRVIHNMLTVPSTHIVIMSYDKSKFDENGQRTETDPAIERIQKFCSEAGHEAQISLLIGSHFGNLPELVENYLPKPAIDLISARQTELLKRRGIDSTGETTGDAETPHTQSGGYDHADSD